MRRKSERNKSKSTEKKTPEPTPRKSRRTSRRRKRSTSQSSSEDSDDAPLKPAVVETKETEVSPPSDEQKVSESRSNSDEDKQEEQPIWKVKTSEAPSGEIQKLKICLQRPPTTPERTEKSPRRRRGKASSQSDDASLTPEEKPQRRKTRRGSPIAQVADTSMESSMIEEAEKDECLIVVKETNEVLIGKGKLDCSQTPQESENEECVQDSRTEIQADESLIETKIKQEMEQESVPIKDETDHHVQPNNVNDSNEQDIVQETPVVEQVAEVTESKPELVQQTEIVVKMETQETEPQELSTLQEKNEIKSEPVIEEQNEIKSEIIESPKAEINETLTQVSESDEKITESVTEVATPVAEVATPVAEVAESVTEVAESVAEVEPVVSKVETPVSEDATPVAEIAKPVSEIATPVAEVAESIQKVTESIAEVATLVEESVTEPKSETQETILELPQKLPEDSKQESVMEVEQEIHSSEPEEQKMEVQDSEPQEEKSSEMVKELKIQETEETEVDDNSTKNEEEKEKPPTEDNSPVVETTSAEVTEPSSTEIVEKTVEKTTEIPETTSTEIAESTSVEITKSISTEVAEPISVEIVESISQVAEPASESAEKTAKIVESSAEMVETSSEVPESTVTDVVQAASPESTETKMDVEEKIIRRKNWGKYKVSRLESAITSTIMSSLFPSLKMLNLEDVKLEVEEPKEKVKKEREVTVMPLSPKEEDPEREVSNIGLNRKISIVNDEASKLQPPPSPAKNPTSSILFITNLVRPFTLKQLQELLSRTGKIIEEGFWTDKIKSKCYVQYETEEEAEATRNALHGVQWPTGNGKKLIIDFGTADSMAAAKNAVVEPVAPKPAPEKVVEKVPELKKEEPPEDNRWEKTRAAAPIREWDLGKVSQDHRERSRSRDRNPFRPDRNDKRKPARNESPSNGDHVSPRKKKKEESEVKMMDDLFHKTKSTPSIYWLPLSPDQIAKKQQQRLQRMAEHKRRMEESRRMERDFGRGAPRSRRRSTRYDGD